MIRWSSTWSTAAGVGAGPGASADRLRWARYRHRPEKPGGDCRQIENRVLVTWRSSCFRIDGLLLPILERLPSDRRAVLYHSRDVLPLLPTGTPAVGWREAIPLPRGPWQAEFRACWPAWRSQLQKVCRKHALPCGAFRRLALHLLVASQSALGCLTLLRQHRPAAIVTEHDRASLWSCLVLAAHSLNIPTFTLQHGVLDDHATGYVPVLADKMYCWGPLHRDQLIVLGEDPERLIIGGCPRLSRELTADRVAARHKLGIVEDSPLVMLGTSPSTRRLGYGWPACLRSGRASDKRRGRRAVAPLRAIGGLCRAGGAHPRVRFLANEAATLDESLAAADLLVVQSSGIGGDALVKRRLVVVVDIPDVPLGHGKDLVEQAGCPLVASAEELAITLRSLLFDDEARRRQSAAADRFVATFCAYFGRDSACRISESILHAIPSTSGVEQ